MQNTNVVRRNYLRSLRKKENGTRDIADFILNLVNFRFKIHNLALVVIL